MIQTTTPRLTISSDLEREYVKDSLISRCTDGGQYVDIRTGVLFVAHCCYKGSIAATDRRAGRVLALRTPRTLVRARSRLPCAQFRW